MHRPSSSTTDAPVAKAFRIQLGIIIQRQRLQCGLTQAELSEHADISLKYMGEVERGEANVSADVIERLAAALDWNPLEALDPPRESLSENVRVMLINETERMGERLETMVTWLRAIDPNAQRQTSGRPKLLLTEGSGRPSNRRPRPR